MTPIHPKNCESNEEKASSPRSRRYKTITLIVITLLLFPLGYFIYSYYQAKEEERIAKEEAERKAAIEVAFYERVNEAAQVMESVNHINWMAKMDEIRKIYDAARKCKVDFDSIGGKKNVSDEAQRAQLAIDSVNRFYAAASIAMHRILERESLYLSMQFKEVVMDFIILIQEFDGSH